MSVSARALADVACCRRRLPLPVLLLPSPRGDASFPEAACGGGYLGEERRREREEERKDESMREESIGL